MADSTSFIILGEFFVTAMQVLDAGGSDLMTMM